MAGNVDNFIDNSLVGTQATSIYTYDWYAYWNDITSKDCQFNSCYGVCAAIADFATDGSESESVAQAVIDYDPTLVPEEYDTMSLLRTQIDFSRQRRPWLFQQCTEIGLFMTAYTDPDTGEDAMRFSALDLSYYT
jgi:hypothetical protein